MQQSDEPVEDAGFAFRGARRGSAAIRPRWPPGWVAWYDASGLHAEAPGGNPTISGAWGDELESISRNVPAFAIWQIDTLERCFYRYCSILQLAGRDARFRRSCVSLMANAERISGELQTVRSTGLWPAFNRAAFELCQDCDLLAALVSHGA